MDNNQILILIFILTIIIDELLNKFYRNNTEITITEMLIRISVKIFIPLLYLLYLLFGGGNTPSE